MTYKISVIVPIFNAENDLKNAINSVINQTIGFENIELILVDDCSTDHSKNIINYYLTKYPNIKAIFLKKNTGNPSKPRNIGIDKSTGEYLMFLDSDDFFVKDYCEITYNIITKEKTDIVYCEAANKFKDGIYLSKDINTKNKNYKNIKIKTEEKINLRCTMWGSIFKSTLIKNNNIKCPNTLHEDGIFALHSYICAKSIIQLPNYFGYIYTVENDNTSITHNISSKEVLLKYLKGFEIIKLILKNNNIEKYYSFLFSKEIPMLYFMFFKFNGSKKDKEEILKKFYEFEKSLNCNIKLKSKPLNIINNAVLNKNYKKAMFYSNIANKLYNQQKIKNFIFKHYFNFKKIKM